MFISLIAPLLIAIPVAADAKEPAAKKELFGKEDWYTKQKGDEKDFTGTLVYKPRGKGVVGFGRFNPYTLDMGKEKGIREVYVGGQEDVLKNFVGKKVTIAGKAVDMDVEGKSHKEIWPARIEAAAEQPKAEPQPKPNLKPAIQKLRPRIAPATLPVVPEKPDPNKPIKICGDEPDQLALAPAPKDEKPAETPKVIASTPGALAVRGKQASTTIIRTEKELAEAINQDATKAKETVAARFNMKEIDFSKQMIVVISAGPKPTGGYSVEITKLEIKDGTLHVRYKVNSPAPNSFVTQAFTNPTVSALVDKFDGKVVFEGPAADKEKPKR